MAATRKKVSQEELRRLMNKHKDQIRDDAKKKVDSPLAKYSADGVLTCVICNSTVRSEAVWSIHINSKLHKNNILAAKQKRAFSNPVSSSSSPEISLKRPNEQPVQYVVPPKRIKGILKNAPVKVSTVPDDFVSSGQTHSISTSDPQLVAAQPVEVQPVEAQPVISKDDRDEEEMEEEQTGSSSDAKNDLLPEGFFDDPVMDAKARKVEYKDPIEEEWERFQKEIKEEVTFSTQIIEEDHEEATAERQIEEIDEQLRNWSRVLELERKKEAVKAAEKIKMEVDEDISSGEEDFNEFLDWRSKKSYI